MDLRVDVIYNSEFVRNTHICVRLWLIRHGCVLDVSGDLL